MAYDRSRIITASWGGWDESLPSILLKANSFKQITGWLINKGKLQSFPNVSAFPLPPDGLVPQGGTSFTDILGFQHTLIITRNNVYYLSNNGTYTRIGSPPLSSFTPFAVEVFLNKVFFCNGTTIRPIGGKSPTIISFLQYTDGSTTFANAGDIPGNGFYLGKLAGRLLILNLIENNQFFPLSVRWSGVNNPLEWNFATDPTAGSALIAEVEDQIQGFSNQKGQGIIYRSQGITIMSPTGSFPAFSFNSFNAGKEGIGVNYSGTLANWADESVFVAVDDVYYFALSAPQPIGGPAKKQIFNDLGNSVNNPVAQMYGTLGQGIDYKSYWLAIPMPNDITSLWIYHFDDHTWVNEQLPFGQMFWMGRVAVA